MNKIVELFGLNCCRPMPTLKECLRNQRCPFTGVKCVKIRKSQPSVAIGTCTISYQDASVIICPFRLLDKNQIFMDCLHLLTAHEPGNRIHLVPEVKIPGGNVDYFLVSARDGKVKDFVGIELQTMDTTGTVWPERQRLLAEEGVNVLQKDLRNMRSFGMNWKMTAKTILVQMHHKAQTFETLNKHFVLIVQDPLMRYMEQAFDFSHVSSALIGNTVHFHSYALKEVDGALRLSLSSRKSTDSDGVGKCLGLKAESAMELSELLNVLETRLSDNNLLSL
ncbi:MAG: hypothetical protein J5985_09825 [Kiritimatiellae bacterium]|nr:hypothetical protein [Kiritimatiellia bacterium]